VRQAAKTNWHHHALTLDLRGFRTLGPGLKVRPDNLRGGVGAERKRLRALGLSAHAAVAGLAQLDTPTERRARALWDGAGPAAQYTRLAGAVPKSVARAMA